MGVFVPSGCLLAVCSLEGLALLRDGQPLSRTDLVRQILHGLQVGFVHSEFMTIIHAHRIYDEMVMDLVFVDMGGHQHLKPFEQGIPFHPLHADAVCLLRRDVLVLMPRLGEMLVGAASGLAVKELSDHHFILDGIGGAVNAGNKIPTGLALFGHIGDRMTYGCV